MVKATKEDKEIIPHLTDAQLRAVLYSKVLLVSKIAGGMEKDGSNTHSGYKFISAEQVMQKVRPALIEAGLHLECSIAGVEQLERKTGGGKATFCTRVNIWFKWVDTETGFQTNAIPWYGEDTDQAKSLAQAITEAHKRFLFKSLCISMPGEIDADSKTPVVASSIIDTRALKEAYKKSPLRKEEREEVWSKFAKDYGKDPDKWSESHRKDLFDELSLTVLPQDRTSDLIETINEGENHE